VLVLLTIGLITFSAGIAIEKDPRHGRGYLFLALLGNILPLLLFKYSQFISENIEALFELINVQVNLAEKTQVFGLVLPWASASIRFKPSAMS
jgi:hypothetical protein